MSDAIVHTLMHEGAMLYPYRASALKNRWRWPFGCCFPPAWTAAHPEDRDRLETAVLLVADDDAELVVELRFLQPHGDEDPREHVHVVARARIDDTPPLVQTIAHPPLHASVSVEVQRLAGAWRIAVAIANESTVAAPARADVLPATLASTHVIMHATSGRFVSVQDPPAALAELARACLGPPLWPFLLGADDRTIVCSPIIVEDHPTLAPESAGEGFDATEIDELLVLRVLTLADAELYELAHASASVRALVERYRSLDPDARARLLGATTLAARRPAFPAIGPGDRVRLRPRARADAFDVILRDRCATVVGTEVDFEGRRWLTVVIDDDPGADLGHAGLPGHRFFFAAEEVEPL